MSAKVNSPYFLVQRSADSLTFAVIDTVSAAQTAAANNAYSAVDLSPYRGPNFYRLVQATPAGDTIYPDVRKVVVPKDVPETFRVSPNPAGGVLHLYLADQATGNVYVRMLDAQGKILSGWTFQKQDQQWAQDIDVGNLEPGSYFVQVLDNTTQVARPILKL